MHQITYFHIKKNKRFHIVGGGHPSHTPLARKRGLARSGFAPSQNLPLRSPLDNFLATRLSPCSRNKNSFDDFRGFSVILNIFQIDLLSQEYLIRSTM